MSKSKQPTSKKNRRELAVKRAKKRKIIIIAAVALVVVLIAAAVIVNVILASGTELYSNGNQSVSFHPDGSFTATLSHGVRRNGTFELSEQDGRTQVSFIQDGWTSAGEIVDGNLIIPEEWRDACGHDPVLPRR